MESPKDRLRSSLQGGSGGLRRAYLKKKHIRTTIIVWVRDDSTLKQGNCCTSRVHGSFEEHLGN